MTSAVVVGIYFIFGVLRFRIDSCGAQSLPNRLHLCKAMSAMEMKTLSIHDYL
jgi:hypothetical protein